jgi:pseudouridine-5'-phosphate glycosidase
MDHDQILYALQAELEAAKQNRDAVSQRFDEIISHVPSGIPYPDSVERIRQASREYSSAQQAIVVALNRINEFLVDGKITEPERKPDAKETADPPNRKTG